MYLLKLKFCYREKKSNTWLNIAVYLFASVGLMYELHEARQVGLKGFIGLYNDF